MTTRGARDVEVLTAVGVATAAAWAVLFSWDNEVVVRDGVETGPYATWQGVALLVVLALVVAAATALGADPIGTAVVLAGTLAACFAVSFTALAPDTDDASLWPLGVALVLGGAFAGALALAAVLAAAGLPGATSRW